MVSGWNQNNGGKLKKGPWTYEEDVRLLRYITLHGPGRWSALAKSAGLQRCGKSCRLRWVNYLRPDLKRGSITPEEEQTILDLHARWGNRWSLIAEKMPGRTDNEIKNYWRSHIRKKHLSPSTRTQNLSSSSSQKRTLEFAATEEDVHQSHASDVKVDEENEPNHSEPAKNSKIENLAGEELDISQTGDKAKENKDGDIHGYYGYQANENNEEESGILRMMCYYSSPEQTATACGFMDTSLWEEYYLESQLDMDLTALWNISLSPHLNNHH